MGLYVIARARAYLREAHRKPALIDTESGDCLYEAACRGGTEVTHESFDHHDRPLCPPAQDPRRPFEGARAITRGPVIPNVA